MDNHIMMNDLIEQNNLLAAQLELAEAKAVYQQLLKELMAIEGLFLPHTDGPARKTDYSSNFTAECDQWKKENKVMRSRHTAAKAARTQHNAQLSELEKVKNEVASLEQENMKMAAFLDDREDIWNDTCHMAPNQMVRFKEENMVLKREWESYWKQNQSYALHKVEWWEKTYGPNWIIKRRGPKAGDSREEGRYIPGSPPKDDSVETMIKRLEKLKQKEEVLQGEEEQEVLEPKQETVKVPNCEV